MIHRATQAIAFLMHSYTLLNNEAFPSVQFCLNLCIVDTSQGPLSCPRVDNAAYKPTTFVRGIQWLDFLDPSITPVSLLRHGTLKCSLIDFLSYDFEAV